jgi:AbrB family looped-hinge helix DNA binding protein
MAIAHSRLTSQGQISVPTSVRRKLGIGPGSVIEWDEDGERIVVRKAGSFDLADTRRVLGSSPGTPRRSLTQLKAGLRAAVRKRYARG